MRTTIDFSFCIVNWNGGKKLFDCLDSIEREITAHHDLCCEIVLVDNHSDDLSKGDLSKYNYLIFHQNQSNKLFSKATNQSITLASGKILVLLNNDTVLSHGFIAETLKTLKNVPEANILVPQLVNPDGTLQANVVGIPKPKDIAYYAFGLNFLSNRWSHWLKPAFPFEEVRVIDKKLQPAFSALIIKRSCWNTVGPLDENFPLLWNDVDWFKRFHSVKLVAFYIPAIKVFHHHGYSVNKHRYWKIIESTDAMKKYMKKHHPTSVLKSLLYEYVYFQLMLLRIARETLLILRGHHTQFRT